MHCHRYVKDTPTFPNRKFVLPCDNRPEKLLFLHWSSLLSGSVLE